MANEAQPLVALNRYLSKLVEGKLWLQVLIGLVLGIVTGILIGPTTGWLELETSVLVGNWLAFPGRLFLATIQMIVIPLVFASIIRGLSGGPDINELKKVGVWVTGFFVVTTAIAAALGIQLALFIEPGSYLSLSESLGAAANADIPAPPSAPLLRDLPDLVIGMLPGNPLNALAEGQMLQIVLFAFIVGIALLSLPPTAAKPLADVLSSV